MTATSTSPASRPAKSSPRRAHSPRSRAKMDSGAPDGVAEPRLVDPLSVYDACERSMELSQGAMARWIEGCGAMNRGASDFLEQRLTADFDLARKLLSARTMAEVTALWSTFAEGAVRDYTGRAGVVSQLASAMLRDQMETARAEADELTEPGREPRID